MRYNQGKKSIIFLVLIALIIAAVIVILSLALRTDPIEENMDKDQVIKVLFVLSDDQNKALSTSVLVYYPVSEKGALFSIPGNTGGIYESINSVDRIDAVYAEKGIEVYCQEIEKLTDMQIPFRIDISLENLALITDLLGGLKVFVPSPVNAYGENGELWLLPSGAVRLDGDKIKTYMNYILPEETEADRESRRQNVLISLFTAITEHKNMIFDKKIFNEFGSKISANADKNGLQRIFEEIANIDSERMSPQSFVGSTRSVATRDGNKRLYFPLYVQDSVKQTVNSLVSAGQAMSGRVYIINIQNGTSVQGLARNTSILLQSVGYDVLGTSNADRQNYEETVIINHIGNREAAESLGGFIHCENIIDEEVKPEEEGYNTAADVDFTIILGSDFDGRYVRTVNKKEKKEEPKEELKTAPSRQPAEKPAERSAEKSVEKSMEKTQENLAPVKVIQEETPLTEQENQEISNKVKALEDALNKLKNEKSQSKTADQNAPLESQTAPEVTNTNVLNSSEGQKIEDLTAPLEN